MALGLLAENISGERRAALSPDAAKRLIGDGHALFVEAGAGVPSGFADADFAAAGCEVLPRAEVLLKAEVLFAIHPPSHDFHLLSGKVLISWVGRLTDSGRELVERARAAGLTLLDVASVPRTTAAQGLDALSSQAKVAGHRAVIEAAYVFDRFQAADMSAAGKYPPSQTFVLGCGIAGLSAIATSRSLGSVVRAWDVRDVSEQCHSMGAKWVSVDFDEAGASSGVYAAESSAEFLRAQRAAFAKVLGEVDIVIATAAVPGKPSPLLITREAVAGMRPGSVIVDLAAASGGNCELTRCDEVFTTANGVTVVGYSNLPSRMARQASCMYAHNMCNLVRHIAGKGKAAALLPSLRAHLRDSQDGAKAGDLVMRSIACCNEGRSVDALEPSQPSPSKPSSPPQPPDSAQDKKVKKDDDAGLVGTAIFGALLAVAAFSCAFWLGSWGRRHRPP